MTFNRQQLISWAPIPFPYGRSRLPAIAPLWINFDFRNPMSEFFYNAYENDGSPSLGKAILNKFNRRVPGFQARWVAVITWIDAVPYPHMEWRSCYEGVRC